MAHLAGARLMRSRIQTQPLVILGIAACGATLLAIPGFHWVFTAIALVTLAVLGAFKPEVMVAVVVLSVPVQSGIMLPFVRGELTMTQLTLFGLIAGWGAIFWRRKIWVDSIVVGFLLVLAAYVISFLAVDNPSLWFQETYRWAVAGIFYVICRSVLHDWFGFRLVIWALIAGIGLVTIMSLFQLASSSVPSHFLVGGVLRVYASFGTPNTLAAYLEMSVPILLACIPIGWAVKGSIDFTHVEKWLLILVPVVGLAVLLMTQSRGGLIGIAAACAVLWLQLPGKARAVSAATAVIVIAGFLATSPGQSQFGRFADLFEETDRALYDESRSTYELGAGRGALWGAARTMIADNPLTGIGAGEFDESYREYTPTWIDRFPRGQAHNVWLHMGAQAGIWGIIAYAWWFVASVWSVITARRRVTGRQLYWLITGVLAVFAAYTLHSLVDYLNVLSLGLLLSVLTAAALNLAPEPLSRYATQRTVDERALSPEIAPCHQ